jgi:arylsulfatase A-like enzyme
VTEPVSLVDVGPGVLDYLGMGIPGELQGQSFMPLVAGQPRGEPRPILVSLERTGHQRVDGIVYDGWKYIRYSGPRESELLFRLDRDPGESRDLAGTASARRSGRRS